MHHPNKFDVTGIEGNPRNLSPNFSNYSSPSTMSHYSRNGFLTTPTRSTLRRYSLADTRLTPPAKARNSNYNTQISTKIDSKSPGYSSRVVQYNEEQEKSLPVNNSKYDRLGIFPIVHFFKKDLPFLKRKSRDEKMNSSDLSKYNSPEHNRMLLEKIITSSPTIESVSSHKSETNTKSVLDALKEISRKRIHSDEEDFISNEASKRIHMDYDSEPISRKRLRHNSQMDDSLINTSPNRFSSIGELMASHSSTFGYVPEKPKKQKIEANTSVQIKTPTPPKYVNVETQTSIPQVIETAQSTPTVEKTEEKNEPQKNTNRETKPKKPSPVKIFDETPLEAMRRNRLTALMGSLTQNIPQNQPTIDTKTEDKKPLVSILSGASKSPHKSNKHVSFAIPETVASTTAVTTSSNIMIPTEITSSPKAANGLNIVTRTSAAIVSPIVSASVVEVAPINKAAGGVRNVTQSVSSFGSNIQIPTVTPSTVSFNSSLSSPNLVLGVKTTSQSEFNSQPEKPSMTNLSPQFKEKITTNREISDGTTQNNFMFTNSSPKPIPTVASTDNSTPKGGFKFDLKEPKSAAAATPPPFSFMAPPAPTPNKTETTKPPAFPQVTSIAPSIKENLPIFGLTSTTTASNQETNIQFASNMNKSFNFTANGNQNLNPTNTASNFAVPASFTPSNTKTSTAPIFGNKLSVPEFSTSSTPVTKPPMFSFVSNPTATTVAGFGSNTNVSTTVAGFGSNTNVSTTVAGFRSNTNVSTTVAPSSFTSFDSAPKSTFGNLPSGTSIFPTSTVAPVVSVASNAQTNPPFGNTVSPFNKPAGSGSSMPSIFAPSTNKTTSTTFSFNTHTSTFNSGTTAPNFGTDNTKSVFGQGAPPSFGTTTTTSTATFGNNPSFGTTTAPTFGPSTAPAFGPTTAPAFGATTAPTFGTTPAPTFGTTTAAAPTFGTTTAPTFRTTAPTFGTTTAPTFGAATAQSFGTTTAPTFGTNLATNSTFGNNTSFGATTTAAGTFGTTSFGPTTTTAPSFGSNGNPTLSTNAFGNTGGAAGNVFGNASGFGGSAGSFGGSTAPNFGISQNPGFNNTNNEPKNNAAPFGTPSNAPFGVTTSSSGFGTNTPTFSASAGFASSSNFGQTNNNAFSSNTFGATSPFDGKAAAATRPEAAPFGNSANPGFSSNFPTAPQGSQGGVFTFGSNVAGAKPPVFSFGATEPPKPSFNFTADSSNNVFGGMNNKGFGGAGGGGVSNPPPPFNSVPPPQFNVQPPGANMFSIGTGGSSTPTRSRTQHKAKRRT